MVEDIFCRIIKGEIKADFVYNDKDFVAIKDINPQAPIHFLIIPKKHIEGIDKIKPTDVNLLGKIFIIAEKIAKKEKISKGYRLILNEGEHSGKVVPHLHIHFIGGKKLGAKIVN